MYLERWLKEAAFLVASLALSFPSILPLRFLAVAALLIGRLAAAQAPSRLAQPPNNKPVCPLPLGVYI